MPTREDLRPVGRSGRLAGGIGGLALAVLASACASSGGVPIPKPFPMPRSAEGPADPVEVDAKARPHPIPPTVEALVLTALDLRGVPYRNGGAGLDGFDCSGFTQFVFARHGVQLPREVREQFRTGRPVDRDALAAGDLLFFATAGSGASHVAILVGEGAFVHAPSERGVVRVERLGARYWSRRFVGARRVR